MNITKEQIKFEEKTIGYKAYVDITKNFLFLPPYIKTVLLYSEYTFDEEDMADMEYIYKTISEEFKDIMFHLDNTLYCDAHEVCFIFQDDTKLTAWNSEWGGISIKK